MTSVEEYLRARDLLQRRRSDYSSARAEFRWPRLDYFNWALEFFDVVPRRGAEALRVVDEAGRSASMTFAELTDRSNQVANQFLAMGLSRGDPIMLCLGNVVPLWESVLGAIKVGLVIIPASTLLTSADLADRLARARVRAVVTASHLSERFDAAGGSTAHFTRLAVGEPVAGWVDFAASFDQPTAFRPDRRTGADDPLLWYFTSGTTARPKIVEHTHASYPVGHLGTMYCLGSTPGDVHLNISSPGWGKHAWSSFFAPWIAEATVLAFDYERFDPSSLLAVLAAHDVTTLCAPPTVWRLLIQQDLKAHPVNLREAISGGEPLNPEVIARVRKSWGVTIRDLYGQTETTAVIATTPGTPTKPGSIGMAVPGYEVTLLDEDGQPAIEGEICVSITPEHRPVGLMTGYIDDDERSAVVIQGCWYRTGDRATIDGDGYITFVGRIDDVFKSSDYRISPFELESVLIEHPAVAEAGVVPSPDARRFMVPKAFVRLADGWTQDESVAESILAHSRRRLAPYRRVRRVEFADDLPKTISGKIRRADLRRQESERGPELLRRPGEFWEEDFPVPDV